MRGREQRNWIDTLLVGFASLCAVYSGGQAVGSDIVSIFAITLVTIGTLLSSFVAWRYRDTKFIRIDGILFLLFGLAAFFGSRYLNLVFEEDTFPRELMPSSWLIWLLIFGSFVLWRDTTLLFQAIPALALFGFVGCYDTFRPVVFYFFVYLVCVATLFARAHARDMADRAERSGYFGADVAALKAGRGMTIALRKGPWRWVAGPEWALGSALAIVVLSLLGAPAIRQGVKPISGIARVVGPRPRNTQTNPATAGGQTTPQFQSRIAQGPVRLRNTPAFDVTGARGRYFRTDSFDAYSRGAWTKPWRWTDASGEAINPPSASRSRRGPNPSARTLYLGPDGEEIRLMIRNSARAEGKRGPDRRAFVMRLTSRRETVELPVPGEFLKFGEGGPGIVPDRGGNLVLQRPRQYEDLELYFSPALSPDPEAKSGARETPPGEEPILDPALSTSGMSPRVAAFALEAAGEGPDGTRAENLRAAIAERIAYNINTEAAPPDSDPVDRALFVTHEGYCDVFASAMVLGARTLGIPARYAVGYLADPALTSGDGTLTLLDSDAHAWAELYFEGQGWVAYDATGGARVVPNGGRRDGDDSVPWYRQPWVPQATNIAIGVLVFGGAALLLWPRKKDARAAFRARDEAVDRFIKTLARTTRRDRRLDESLVAYVTALGDKLGSAKDSAAALALDFERGLYGPADPDPATNADLIRRVQSLRHELKAVPKSSTLR